MTTPNDPTMSHDSLDAVIAAYMLAVESGDVPNRQELLDQYLEHADALRPSSPISIAWTAWLPPAHRMAGLTKPAQPMRTATPRSDRSLSRRLRAIGGDRTWRHGDRLQGPSGIAEPAGCARR